MLYKVQICHQIGPFLLAAESSQEKKWTIKQISDHLSIPQHFLGKILQELVPRNIISSMKGPTGGFYMNEQNGQLHYSL